MPPNLLKLRKKSRLLKKELQMFFTYLEKVAKILSFWEKIGEIPYFALCIVDSDLIEKKLFICSA